MHDAPNGIFREEFLHALAVCQVQFYELKRIQRRELRETSFFQPHIIVVIHIVEADDVIAAIDQTPGNMKTDESGHSGHERERSHGVIPCRVMLSRLRARALFHKGRFAMNGAIEIQRHEGLSGWLYFDPSAGLPEYIQRPCVMIPAAVGRHQRFQIFRWFPMGGQQCSSSGIALTKHEREMIRIPVRTASCVRDEQSRLRRGAEIREIVIGQIAVFPDVQPFPGMGECGVGSLAANFKQLLLGSEQQIDRPILFHQAGDDVIL